MHLDSTDTGNPYHMDTCLIFIDKGGVRVAPTVTAGPGYDGEFYPPQIATVSPGRDDNNLMHWMSDGFFQDFIAQSLKYRQWKPGGMKFTFSPQGNASGVAYVINQNQHRSQYVSENLNAFIQENSHTTSVPTTTLPDAFDLTLGSNLDKCRKYACSVPFTHYFKRKVPAGDRLPHGGWVPTPWSVNNDYSNCKNPDKDQIGANLSSGMAACYFQMDDKYFHSVSKEARNLMVQNSRYIPIGTVKVTQYYYFKGFNKEYTTSTVLVPRPDNTLAIDYDLDHPMSITNGQI